MKRPTGGKGGAVDPSPLRTRCQECHGALLVVGADSGMHASAVQGSTLGASRMDSSYVVLSKNNRSQGLGIPPRPRSAAAPYIEPNQPPKPIEASYIMLPPPAASIYKTSSSEGVGRQLLPPSVNSSSSMPGNNSGFLSSVTVLKRAFEIATSQTQVKQPLCLECMRILSDKMDFEIEDIGSDIKAYEASLQHLEQESYSILSETDFQKEKQKNITVRYHPVRLSYSAESAAIQQCFSLTTNQRTVLSATINQRNEQGIEEEEKELRADIEEAEKQYSEVISEMKDLETKSKQFKELKEQYWLELNSSWFQRTSHQEEHDAILAKIEVSQAHLELLKQTNVLNDAFYISQHGVFGTINNLRLGHSHEVEWDEINAALGQVALLLHIMAQYFTPKFQYRIKIHAVGSYPRITDINNKTYKLFGPANVLFSTRYDDAMTWFLRCLQEFVEFAVSLDKENNVPPDKSLKVPYKIDGDKIGGYRVVLGDFNTKENSTKALKNMLCVLKWVLYWFNDTGRPCLDPQFGGQNLYSAH